MKAVTAFNPTLLTTDEMKVRSPAMKSITACNNDKNKRKREDSDQVSLTMAKELGHQKRVKDTTTRFLDNVKSKQSIPETPKKSSVFTQLMSTGGIGRTLGPI